MIHNRFAERSPLSVSDVQPEVSGYVMAMINLRSDTQVQYTDRNWEQQAKYRKPELHKFRYLNKILIFKALKKNSTFECTRSPTGSISGSAFWCDKIRTYSSGCQVSLEARSRFP